MLLAWLCANLVKLLQLPMKGAKIRSTYIAHALKEKSRLEDEVRALAGKIEVKEAEVARLRGSSGHYWSLNLLNTTIDIADRADSLSAEALEHRKQSRKY